MGAYNECGFTRSKVIFIYLLFWCLGCDNRHEVGRIQPDRRAVQESAEAAEHLLAVERRFKSVVATSTRLEIVIGRVEDRQWQRIGPFVIDDERELAEIKMAAENCKVISNRHPFSRADTDEYLVIEWLITSPAKKGSMRMVSIGGNLFVFERMETNLVMYDSELLYAIIEKIALERSEKKVADVFSGPQ